MEFDDSRLYDNEDYNKHYVLMEDDTRGKKRRRMSLPLSSNGNIFLRTRNATSVVSSNPYLSESSDVVTDLPTNFHQSLKPSSLPARPGILRSSSTSQMLSDSSREKKQVSITLPESSQPIFSPRLQRAKRDTENGDTVDLDSSTDDGDYDRLELVNPVAHVEVEGAAGK